MTVDQPTRSSRASRPLAVVVLAAGLGTRMKSDLPKVLHQVCGRPMLAYVIDAARSARAGASGRRHRPRPATRSPPSCRPAASAPCSSERRGSGDAVRAGMEPLAGFDGDVMVLERRRAAGRRRAARRPAAGTTSTHGAAATITTVVLDDPAHYGRVSATTTATWRASSRRATPRPTSAAIDEINVGFYVFDAADAARLRCRALSSRQRPGRALPDRPRPPASSTPATAWPPS